MLNGEKSTMYTENKKEKLRLSWLYCDCRYIAIWLLVVILLSTALGVALYFLVIAKEPYKGPPFLPTTLRPLSYNVTLRLLATYDSGRSDYDGAVTIELICLNSTDRIYIHKGDNIRIGRVSLKSVDGDAPDVDSIRHDGQTDITTIKLSDFLATNRTYLLQITSFNGQMSTDSSQPGLQLFQYRTTLGQTRFGATFATEEAGLRHVFPSFDSADFPSVFNMVIVRASTLRSITNAKRDITVKKSEDFLEDHYFATPKLVPADLAIVLCDFQYIRLQQAGLQIDVFFRPEIIANISVSADRMVQFADKRMTEMGKLDAVAVPGLKARFDKPGLSLIPEKQALEDAAAIAELLRRREG
uniref:Aminopeptidase N-like N-terminal domain-containing protein n=1 Tax=Plectus sambesii TaxID=2011161 RepID=A0A914VWU5_9BILA